MKSGKLQNISSQGGPFDHYIGLMYSDGNLNRPILKNSKPWGIDYGDAEIITLDTGDSTVN